MFKFKDILAFILGAGIFSFGIYFLVIPFHFYEGGATGITLITYYLLKAELKRNTDGTYTLTRLDGSVMKIVVDNKWVKIPKELTFNLVYKTSK